jgi:hypothetical protein
VRVPTRSARAAGAGLAALLVVVAVACDSGQDPSEALGVGTVGPSAVEPAITSSTMASASVATVTSVSPSVPTATFSVDELGMQFELPESFRPFDDPDYDFAAVSGSDHGFLSIISAEPDIVGQPVPRAGETHRALPIPGVVATQIEDAAIQGLPDELAANELVVANGDRSFSLILTADVDAIDGIWAVFVSSLTIEPAR